MDQADIDEIIACLPTGRTLFPYFKDRYTLMLLSYFVGAGKPMRAIKQSPFGRYRRAGSRARRYARSGPTRRRTTFTG